MPIRPLRIIMAVLKIICNVLDEFFLGARLCRECLNTTLWAILTYKKYVSYEKVAFEAILYNSANVALAQLRYL